MPPARREPQRNARRPEDVLARRGGSIELLRVPAAVFGGLARLRGRLYDRGWLPAARLDAPVVSVGNLSVGGTGKTPMVLFLARALQRRGRRPGVLARGYKAATAGAANDEALVVRALAPELPQVLDADRVRGGRRLIELGADVVLLDDGFQHRRLQRELDVVLVDATRPWGLPASDGRSGVRALLPRGLLRESPSALERADVLVLTRADQVSADEREALERELFALAPGKPLLWAVHRPAGLRSLTGREELLSDLEGRPVRLLSGVGNPEAFEESVRALGASVREHRVFPDHHAYDPSDLEPLAEGEEWIVTTAKDAVKLAVLEPAPALARLRVLSIELAITRGAAVLDALLDALGSSRAERVRGALHEGLHG